MSERVTWTACPRCGGLAAVGWASVVCSDGRARELPVEVDCAEGCRPTLDELRRLLDRVLGDRRWWEQQE
jgi:hypothetical protein